MRSEKKEEARSVNPVQAQIKSLSGAILTIIDATYTDPAQREAVKSLVKAEIRRKMDVVTDEWILRTLQIGVNITKTPKPSEIPVTSSSFETTLTSGWKLNPEEYTQEELKRLQDLEEEVVEVDGVEFAKETLTEKVVVDGVEFEKEKNPPPTFRSQEVLGQASGEPRTCAIFTPSPLVSGKTDSTVEVVGLDDDRNPMTTTFALNKRHVAKANSLAEAEPRFSHTPSECESFHPGQPCGLRKAK